MEVTFLGYGAALLFTLLMSFVLIQGQVVPLERAGALSKAGSKE
jgi:hypothetical protein